MKQHTKYQLLWYKAIHLTVCEHLKARLEKLKNRNSRKGVHLQWRIAYNLFNGGDLFAASTIFDILCSSPDETSFPANDSFVHQMAGRCSTQLFLTTQSHYHLENAHMHYQNAVDTMPVNLFTTFKLPVLLIEFGNVLEFYGAFESAIEVYSRIMTNFPNFRGYFDALYRTAIVSRHLASCMGAGEAREDAINKCIDVFQFLLEALPASISDVHCVLAYGRTLELSANQALKYRSIAVYTTLYDLCKRQRIADANKFKTAKLWQEDLTNWLKLGDEISQSHDFLVAKDAYQKFIDEKEKVTHFGGTLQSVLTVDVCLKLAKSFAFYQNYQEAVRFVEISVSIDRFHKETRMLMSKWNKIYASEFQAESHAIQSIVSTWKGRCWTGGFVKKLRRNVVSENEQKVDENRYDLEARDTLAYYARDKWRARFLYEEHCAITIQRKVRALRRVWMWMEVQHKQHEAKASDMYRKYMKAPMDKATRDEVKRVMSNRFAPRKHHPLIAVNKLIEKQEMSIKVIKRSILSYSIRRVLAEKIQFRLDVKNAVLYDAATIIQSVVRMNQSHLIVARVKKLRKLELKSALIVQRFVRWRRKTFQHTVTRSHTIYISDQLKKQKAMRSLKQLLPFKVKAFLRRKRDRIFAAAVAEMTARNLALQERVALKNHYAAILIQTFWRVVNQNFIQKLSMKIIKLRHHVEYSLQTTTHLCSILTHYEHTKYRNPGLGKNTQQFNAVLQQHTVYCDESFSSVDCLMLSMVLKHTYCHIKSVILHDVHDTTNPSYTFDLLPALIANKSLTSVTVLGGDYSEQFINGLIYCIQVENPRIVHLSIEKLDNVNKHSEDVAIYSGRLVMDYFNYSIPGIMQLSLHGCGLRDLQIDNLVNGMKVNTSLTELILSCNILTDVGFNAIFNSIMHNRKSKLIKLDCSYNLIKCDYNMTVLLKSYKHHHLKTYLTLYLINNIIYKEYNTADSLFKNKRIHCKIVYHYDEIEDANIRNSNAHMEIHSAVKRPNSRGLAKSGNAFFKQAVRTVIPDTSPEHITRSVNRFSTSNFNKSSKSISLNNSANNSKQGSFTGDYLLSLAANSTTNTPQTKKGASLLLSKTDTLQIVKLGSKTMFESRSGKKVNF